MTPRTRLVPIDSMAWDLAQTRPVDRATPDAAALLLVQCGYRAEDVAAGLDRALSLAGELVVDAASDALWARLVGHVRDGVSAVIILGAGAWWWGVLA